MDKNIWYIHGSMADYELSHRDGQYYIRYCLGKLKKPEFQPFTSERDPEKEALRIAGSFKLKKGLMAVVIGAGNIKLIEHLKIQQVENGGDILVFESDFKLYQGIKKIIPELYNQVNVISQENFADLTEFVGNCTLESMLGYRFLPHSRAYQIDPGFYTEMENRFKSLFSIRFSDLLTRIEFEARWILNGLLNLPRFLNAIPVKAVFDKAKGENALLISSGPGLREALPWLKKNQKKYFIACVDSAYRVLARSKITPHLIFTLDSQIFTWKHFQGLPCGEPGKFPVLYADLVSNPVAVRNWKGNILAGMTAHYTDTKRDVTPGCDFIEEEFFRNTCGDLQSGGSVATSLFDLLRNMNFSTITLLGQDLAFTNREIHCTGTHHTDIWVSKNINRLESFENINNKVLKKRHIVWGKSMKGAPLPEDYIFSIYRKWFEESIATVPVKVMNAGMDGAKIRGTKPLVVPDREFSEKFAEKISKVVFSDSYDFIDVEKLKQFYNKVIEQKPQTDNLGFKDLKFMNRIGKKYFIKHLRNQMRKDGDYAGQETSADDLYLRLMEKERQVFWNILQKRIQKYYRFINKDGF